MSHPTAIPARRGFTITEMIVSMILLGTVIGIVSPLTRRAIDQRRAVETRRAALIELSNTLERIVADRSAWPNPGSTQSAELPVELSSKLREARLEIASVSLDGPPSGRRFDASLTWIEPTGRRTSPMRLSVFAFDERAAVTAEGGAP